MVVPSVPLATGGRGVAVASRCITRFPVKICFLYKETLCFLGCLLFLGCLATRISNSLNRIHNAFPQLTWTLMGHYVYIFQFCSHSDLTVQNGGTHKIVFQITGPLLHERDQAFSGYP